MAWFETWIKNDLAKPINVVQLQGVMFNLDNLANKIGVELEYNGQPAALEGTIAGYVIKNDGTTLNLTTNTGKEGNKAWVILPQEAYTVEGPISIVIKLVYNSAETTIGACAGYVTRSRTSSEIAPTGTVIPSLASLEAAIAAANAAAANAADATDYIAPTEEDSTASEAHAVGSYFIYNGKLMNATSAIAQGATIVPYASGVTNYNCAEVPNGLSGAVYNMTNTANAAANNAADAQRLVAPVESFAGMPTGVATMAHATGSYFVLGGVLYQATADIAVGATIVTSGTGANAAQVPGGVTGEVEALSGDVADLKSALMKKITNSQIEWTDGRGVRYDTGVLNNTTAFKASKPILLPFGFEILEFVMPCFTPSSGTNKFGLAFYNANMEYISGIKMSAAPQSGNTAEVASALVPEEAVYFRTTWYRDSYDGYTYDGDFYVLHKTQEIPIIKVADTVWTSKTAIRYDTGATLTSTNFKISSFIQVTDVLFKITIPCYTSNSGGQTSYGLAFYNANKEYISGVRMPIAPQTGNTAEVISVTAPSNAVYFRTTWYDDSYTGYTYDGNFYYTTTNYNSYLMQKLTDPKNAGKYLIVESDGKIGFSGYVPPVPTSAEEITVILGQEEINYFYGLTNSGLVDSNLFGVTSYIDCLGTETINVRMPIITSGQSAVGLAFYDGTKTQLSFIASNVGGANGAEIREIPVPSGATYFRATYWNYEQAQTYGEWYCAFISAQYGYGKYRPYQDGYIFYSPKVNQAVNQYWETDLATEQGEDYEQTTGVLLLPTTYTSTGKPTPVIMYFHGISHYVYYDHWGDGDAFRTQKAQWAAQGFAVIDCNGARNNNKTGGFTSGGSLQYSDGYHKCYEYVKQHYNVEDYCHVICASAGGIPGINYCYWFNDVKSLQMLSAWTDLKNNSYANGQTASMIEYLGCDFTNGYDATKDKTIGFDPTLRIITVDGVKYLPQGKIPMKAYLGSTEQGNHIWNALQNYVTALRNAGQSVSLRVVNGATHKNICSDDILALNTEYANFCKSV